MMKYVFIILLSTHILGDFYFQTEKVAERKKEEFKWVLLHSIIYAVISAIMISIVMPGLSYTYTMILTISHGVIDILKFVICSCKLVKDRTEICSNKNIFIIDQMIHLVIIIFVTYSAYNYSTDRLFNNQIRDCFNLIEIPETLVLSLLIKILLIHKPANILISSILEKYKPLEEERDGSKRKNAGRFIGTLERIIMTIFITINQYSVVGLVLTAKSITRYNKISEEPEFAEYYLLGTLLSAICAICVSILF